MKNRDKHDAGLEKSRPRSPFLLGLIDANELSHFELLVQGRILFEMKLDGCRYVQATWSRHETEENFGMLQLGRDRPHEFLLEILQVQNFIEPNVPVRFLSAG